MRLRSCDTNASNDSPHGNISCKFAKRDYIRHNGQILLGRTFSVVSDTIKVLENPAEQIGQEDVEVESAGQNLIKSAYAKRIVFRRKGDAEEPEPTEGSRGDEPENKYLRSLEENLNNNNSETNACSEVTEDLTENNEMTEMTEEVNEEAMIEGENEVLESEVAVQEKEEQPCPTADSAAEDQLTAASDGGYASTEPENTISDTAAPSDEVQGTFLQTHRNSISLNRFRFFGCKQF